MDLIRNTDQADYIRAHLAYDALRKNRVVHVCPADCVKLHEHLRKWWSTIQYKRAVHLYNQLQRDQPQHKVLFDRIEGILLRARFKEADRLWRLEQDLFGSDSDDTVDTQSDTESDTTFDEV